MRDLAAGEVATEKRAILVSTNALLPTYARDLARELEERVGRGICRGQDRSSGDQRRVGSRVKIAVLTVGGKNYY